jgi:hypothetical protein
MRRRSPHARVAAIRALPESAAPGRAAEVHVDLSALLGGGLALALSLAAWLWLELQNARDDAEQCRATADEARERHVRFRDARDHELAAGKRLGEQHAKLKRRFVALCGEARRWKAIAKARNARREG